MDISQPASLFELHPSLPLICDILGKQETCRLFLKGLAGSSASVIVSTLLKKQADNFLIILADSENAAYFHNDLIHLLDENRVLFFPSSYKRSVHYELTDPINITLRTEVLQKILNAGPGDSFTIVTYPEAIAEPVVSQQELSRNTYKVEKGEKL